MRNSTASTKKTTPAVEPADTVIKFTMEELMRRRALEAEVKGARAYLNMVAMQIEQVIANNPGLKRLLTEKEDQAKELSKKTGELNVFNVDIEAKYGIKLSECSYDDETGVIQILKKEEPPKVEAPKAVEAPAEAPKRRRRRSS